MGANSTSMRDRSSEGHRVEGAGPLPLLTDILWLEDRGRKFRTGGQTEGISKPYD